MEECTLLLVDGLDVLLPSLKVIPEKLSDTARSRWVGETQRH